MVNRVLIDTSTFYSASLADFDTLNDMTLLSEHIFDRPRADIWEAEWHEDWRNRAIVLSFFHLLESTILYDRIIVDSASINKCEDALEIKDQISEAIDLFEINGKSYIKLYQKTLNELKQTKDIDLLNETELNLVMGHFERDFEKIELDDRIYRDIDNWSRSYSITINGISNDMSNILEDLLSLRWNIKDKHLRRYLDEMDTNPMGLWPMLKVYLNFFRIIYYYNLSRYLEVNYSPHPLRNKIWSDKKYIPLIAKDIISFFDKNVRQKAIIENLDVFPSLNIDLSIPVIYKYITKNARSTKDLFHTALEIRESEEARRFREFCAKLENAYRNRDNNKFIEYRDLIKEASNDWAECFSKSRSSKKLTISDPFGIISTELSLPSGVLFDSRTQGPLVFVHHLMSIM
jgi:hypothetical protein